MKKVAVLGAGISGLSTAYWLKKNNFDFVVLEKENYVGGSMQTIRKDGFQIDFGPNSGLETTPIIRQIVDDIGFANEMVYASDSANKRYILRNDTLHALPTSPPAFLSTKLFSTKAKLRLFAEPFIGKSADGYYQSMSDFVRRRLGQEFLDYAIDPFVSGVFAGDPNKLSVKSAFPKLYRLEEVYGGLIKGMIKGAKERKQRAEQSKQNAKMFSFVNGMQSFAIAIADTMKENILLNAVAQKVEKQNEKWKINYSQNGELKELVVDYIISTIPVYAAEKLFTPIDKEFQSHANEIYYPPVMVLYLGYKKSQVETPLDGFGYLIPSKEKKNYLGAIWSSAIFPNRCDDDKAAFTLFVGGARSPHLFEMGNEKLVEIVIKEFHETMKIIGDPILIEYKHWQKAIPQYNIGYIEHENYFDKFERENKGIILSGNYRGGISVGDCIKNSEINYNKIIAN
ncbi:protoporphyrinogen oxidase [Stygiobacter electus]|uniref:Coproporphyrinogen III oxidase n=1 Tax=Stygiobacter electus TaxID=3032292 RepID=A0AAE3P111_9BACT|nr:protoporphyrinogen oxidase [Stygiobacter electus]MDF1611737.1 protoporphyrinogen oxidase [Stygiobacter electus]